MAGETGREVRRDYSAAGLTESVLRPLNEWDYPTEDTNE